MGHDCCLVSNLDVTPHACITRLHTSCCEWLSPLWAQEDSTQSLADPVMAAAPSVHRLNAHTCSWEAVGMPLLAQTSLQRLCLGPVAACFLWEADCTACADVGRTCLWPTACHQAA